MADSTWYSTARAWALRSGVPSKRSDLLSSMYQSQNSLQAKSYTTWAARPRSLPWRWSVTWRMASFKRLKIHFSWASSWLLSTGPGRPSMFISTKREAFHTLLAKLRAASLRSVLTRMSAPGATPRIREKRRASAP